MQDFESGEQTHRDKRPAWEIVTMILSAKYMLETVVATPLTVPLEFLVLAGKCSCSIWGAREMSRMSLARPSTTAGRDIESFYSEVFSSLGERVDEL